MAEKKIYTDSDIEIKSVYTEQQTANHQPQTELPGTFTFTSGIQPDMYRGKL